MLGRKKMTEFAGLKTPKHSTKIEAKKKIG